VTLLSPLCVSSSCSGLFTHKRVVFAREKKKGKKQKEFVTERRENNTEEEISLPSNVKIFKERGARAYTLSSSSSSSNARRKVFSLASSSRIKEEEGLEGAFAARVLEKERERRAGESGTQGEKRRSDKKIYPRRVITQTGRGTFEKISGAKLPPFPSFPSSSSRRARK